MSQVFTLEISDEVVERASEVAAHTHRTTEDVLKDWLAQAAEAPIESLSDEQILQLADMQMKEAQQEELSLLLAKSREGETTAAEERRLDELMRIYRRGMVRKSHALKVAVERGLRPPLS